MGILTCFAFGKAQLRPLTCWCCVLYTWPPQKNSGLLAGQHLPSYCRERRVVGSNPVQSHYGSRLRFLRSTARNWRRKSADEGTGWDWRQAYGDRNWVALFRLKNVKMLGSTYEDSHLENGKSMSIRSSQSSRDYSARYTAAVSWRAFACKYYTVLGCRDRWLHPHSRWAGGCSVWYCKVLQQHHSRQAKETPNKSRSFDRGILHVSSIAIEYPNLGKYEQMSIWNCIWN